MTVDEYMELEASTEMRHEFLGGDVYAMGGASARHNIISRNMAFALHARLRGGPCTVFIHDMKVRLFADQDTYFYYPDVMVACDPSDDAPYYRDRPSILIEVMSESTERVDRREKFFAYRTIPDLRQYVLVDQEKVGIESFVRSGEKWSSELLADSSAALKFESVGARIPLAEVYEGSGVTAS